MLLSDCCIAFANNSKDARLQIEQKDRDFVELLWDLFNSIGIVGAKPRLVTRKGVLFLRL